MSTLSTPPLCVAITIAAYHRDSELARLFESLAKSNTPITGGIFVADNAASSNTAATCAASPIPVHWLPRKSNNGPGPAWNTAIHAALTNPEVTHVFVLDDDVVIPSDTLHLLLQALETSGAAAAAPLLFDHNNHLWGFPEPLLSVQRPLIRRLTSSEECLAALGTEPLPFCWATGACMLYTRAAFSNGGFREDFWMLGEDLEFSMRTAATQGGVFIATAQVPHLPPPAPPDTKASQTFHHKKFLSLLQNLSYLSFHSPHSAHLRRYLLGNYKRFFLTQRPTPRHLLQALQTFYQGALKAHPRGHTLTSRVPSA